jgi:hypothetical protein
VISIVIAGGADPPEQGRRPAEAPTTSKAKAKAKAPDDALIFRPTVLVRRGNGQGSGTIIASVEGETLVLTAAHVVNEEGPVGVELHRYNLGVEQVLRVGGWPLTLPGEVAAADPAADTAVVRIRGRPELPFVARIAAPGDDPGPGSEVTSVGIDGGNRLKSWSTEVRGALWFAMRPGPGPDKGQIPARVHDGGAVAHDDGDRQFLVTDRAPEHGRSGGGLFLDGGRVAGVCVGRIDLSGGRAVGVFSSVANVRQLLRDHDLDTTIARSEAAHSRPLLTPTRARSARPSSQPGPPAPAARP